MNDQKLIQSTRVSADGTTATLTYRKPLLDRVPWMTIASILLASAFVLGSIADQLPPKLAIPAGTIITVAGILGRVAYQFASRPVIDVVKPQTVVDNRTMNVTTGD